MTNDTKPKRIILKSAGVNPKVVAAAKKVKSKKAATSKDSKNTQKPKIPREQWLSLNPHIAKRERFKKACAVKKRFCQDFPKIFDPKNPRPLAKGTFKVIRQKYPECAYHTVKFAVYLWCNQKAYKANLKAGAMRVDLEGNDAGVVLESEIPEFDNRKSK